MEIFNEDQVTSIADKVLIQCLDRIKEDFSSTYYNEMRSYLHEHYDNAKNDAEKNLITTLAEEFIADPTHHKYFPIRKALIRDNMDLLIPILTDTLIKDEVSKVVWDHLASGVPFQWRWEEYVLKAITANWEQIKDLPGINKGLLRSIATKEASWSRERAKLTQELNHYKKALVNISSPNHEGLSATDQVDDLKAAAFNAFYEAESGMYNMLEVNSPNND